MDARQKQEVQKILDAQMPGFRVVDTDLETGNLPPLPPNAVSPELELMQAKVAGGSTYSGQEILALREKYFGEEPILENVAPGSVNVGLYIVEKESGAEFPNRQIVQISEGKIIGRNG